ncbi:MAG: class I SAM-dependent methyltransferase [Sphingomonadales bacterium]
MATSELPDREAEDAARTVSRKIAADYDAYVYDPTPPGGDFAARLFGAGALYGCAPAMGDVLDLGCGTGRFLEVIARGLRGRAVGIDLSAAAVAQAKVNCATLGDRARIVQADILDVEPRDLGQFDLVCNVGVHYVVPPEVRRRLTQLAAACLRPGGLLLISYYVGPVMHARTALYRLLRAKDNPDAPPPERVAAARRHLKAVKGAAAGLRDQALIESIARSVLGLKDATLFHEVFNPLLEVLDTESVAADLAPWGLRFLTFANGGHHGGLGTSRERLSATADQDMLSGGYRYALFGKTGDADAIFDIRTPNVRWRLNGKPLPELSDAQNGVYEVPPGGRHVKVNYKVTRFALALLEGAEKPLAELTEAARRHMPGFDPDGDVQRLERNMALLWSLGLVQAVRGG